MLGTVRIGMTVGGDVLARPSAPSDVVAEARQAEDEGFATAWSVHFTRALIVPGLTAAAAGRAAPRVVAALPVAVTDDPSAARSVAEEAFGRYNGMENYRRLFEREGVASVGELAVVGTEADVEKQLRSYADIGVTDLWPAVYPVGADEAASVRRTRELLSHL
jgi:alkanesulfonate monooxygenase SsuD/methylene tetrahydromethanopterin reductase-like flavin-dependent oxidoreductase (luciferase family)